METRYFFRSTHFKQGMNAFIKFLVLIFIFDDDTKTPIGLPGCELE